MNLARTKTEAQIRAAIAAAENAAQEELERATLCADPKNIHMRQMNAAVHRETAAEYRHALAEHLLLDGIVYHAMPETVQ